MFTPPTATTCNVEGTTCEGELPKRTQRHFCGPKVYKKPQIQESQTRIQISGSDSPTSAPPPPRSPVAVHSSYKAAAHSQWAGGIRGIGRWRDFAQPQLPWGPGPSSFCASWPRLRAGFGARGFRGIVGSWLNSEISGVGVVHPMESAACMTWLLLQA